MQKRSSNVCLGLLLVARNSLKGSAHPCFFMGDGKRTTTIVANSSTICGSTWRPSLADKKLYDIKVHWCQIKIPRRFFFKPATSLGSRVQNYKSAFCDFFWKFGYDKFNSNYIVFSNVFFPTNLFRLFSNKFYVKIFSDKVLPASFSNEFFQCVSNACDLTLFKASFIIWLVM